MNFIKVILLVAIFALISCNESNKNVTLEMGVWQDDNLILAEGQLNEILSNENDYSFNDLHDFYLEVKDIASHKDEHKDLRRRVMERMKLDGTLVNHSDKNIIEFYTNEIIGMEFISDMELLAFLLTKLKGHWPIKKINSTAEKMYNRNIKYIYDNFDDPQNVLEEQGTGVNRLKMISNLKES